MKSFIHEDLNCETHDYIGLSLPHADVWDRGQVCDLASVCAAQLTYTHSAATFPRRRCCDLGAAVVNTNLHNRCCCSHGAARVTRATALALRATTRMPPRVNSQQHALIRTATATAP